MCICDYRNETVAIYIPKETCPTCTSTLNRDLWIQRERNVPEILLVFIDRFAFAISYYNYAQFHFFLLIKYFSNFFKIKIKSRI